MGGEKKGPHYCPHSERDPESLPHWELALCNKKLPQLSLVPGSPLLSWGVSSDVVECISLLCFQVGSAPATHPLEPALGLLLSMLQASVVLPEN